MLIEFEMNEFLRGLIGLKRFSYYKNDFIKKLFPACSRKWLDVPQDLVKKNDDDESWSDLRIFKSYYDYFESPLTIFISF